MFNCGFIQKSEKHPDYPFSGEIQSMMLKGRFGLMKNEKRSDRSPDYHVHMDVNGDLMPVGSVWVKDVTNGEFAGSQLMSMTLQTQEMANPLNVVAYQDSDNPEKFNIQWKPKRSGKKDGASAGSAKNDLF